MTKEKDCGTSQDFGAMKARVNNLEVEQRQVRLTAHAASNTAMVANAKVDELKDQFLDKRISVLEQWQKDFNEDFDKFSNETKTEITKLVEKNQNFLIAAGIIFGIIEVGGGLLNIL